MVYTLWSWISSVILLSVVFGKSSKMKLKGVGRGGIWKKRGMFIVFCKSNGISSQKTDMYTLKWQKMKTYMGKINAWTSVGYKSS